MVLAALKDAESVLIELQNSKAPGISGSRINKLVRIAIDNIETNASHKLGMLYVVDAIARSFQDHAKKSNESLENPIDRSYSGGLQKFSEIVESLVTNMLNTSQEQYLDRIAKVLDIWERANTFSSLCVQRLRTRLSNARRPTEFDVISTPTVEQASSAKAEQLPRPDPAAILAALANIAKAPLVVDNQTSQFKVTPINSIATIDNSLAAQDSITAFSVPVNDQVTAAVSKSFPNVDQAATAAAAITTSASIIADPDNRTSGQTNSIENTQVFGFSQQQIQLVQLLLSQGLNASQIQTILAGMQNAPIAAVDTFSKRKRQLSQSPTRLTRFDRVPRQEPKDRFFLRDETLAAKTIKVLSRTLFVGGVMNEINESQLKSKFSEIGPVQSVIAGQGSRHAFLKMYRRSDAEVAVRRFGNLSFLNSVLRTKWGVGFGPRDCCDYNTGISVIPISQLTEMDRNWIVTAENGGTGGLPLEEKIVIEEPDIVVGVSSKGINKKSEFKSRAKHDLPKVTKVAPNISLLQTGIPDVAAVFGSAANGQVHKPVAVKNSENQEKYEIAPPWHK